jgi:hypothetical protein
MKSLDQRLSEIDKKLEYLFTLLDTLEPGWKFEYYFSKTAKLCSKRITMILRS